MDAFAWPLAQHLPEASANPGANGDNFAWTSRTSQFLIFKCGARRLTQDSLSQLERNRTRRLPPHRSRSHQEQVSFTSWVCVQRCWQGT